MICLETVLDVKENSAQHYRVRSTDRKCVQSWAPPAHQYFRPCGNTLSFRLQIWQKRTAEIGHSFVLQNAAFLYGAALDDGPKFQRSSAENWRESCLGGTQAGAILQVLVRTASSRGPRLQVSGRACEYTVLEALNC